MQNTALGTKFQDSTNDRLLLANGRRPYDDNPAPLVANSPQPSASSNSDSGIGFRDDCGNISDRILVVEFPAQQLHQVIAAPTSTASNRPAAIDESNISLDNLDMPLVGPDDLNNVCSEHDAKKCVEDKENDIIACIAKNVCSESNNEPDAVRYSERPVDVPIGTGREDAFDNVSVHSSKSVDLKGVFKTPVLKLKSAKKQLKLVGSYDNLLVEKRYKFGGPKVKPNHSCEELNVYGSLQDLTCLGGKRSIVAQSEPDVRVREQQRRHNSSLVSFQKKGKHELLVVVVGNNIAWHVGICIIDIGNVICITDILDDNFGNTVFYQHLG